MSPDLHSLLARGYFPKELPHPFTTESFAKEVDLRSRALPGEFDGAQPETSAVRHDFVRPGHLPRRFHIPNPSAAVEVARLIAENWTEIDERLRQSRFSTSRPVVGDANSERALDWSHTFRQRHSIAAELRASASYLAKADISLFYGSMYTHTIPWALHGKAVAKRRRKDQTLLGNRLDRAIQRGQDGQTVGIPISPDWSWVIAELLLTSVDEELAKRLPGVGVFRVIDDYEFACESEAQAHSALAVLRAVLSEFELQLNSGKTEIHQFPSEHAPSWLAELQSFRFRTSVSGQHDDLVTYYDRAIGLRRRFKTATPLSFAVGRLRYLRVRPENWPLMHYLLLEAVMSEPDCIRNAMKCLYANMLRGLPIDSERIGDSLSNLIIQHAPLGDGSEVAWAIWSALVFGVDLPRQVGREVSKMQDPVVALLALDANARGRLNGLATRDWVRRIKKEALRDRDWLLAYEAPKKGWLGALGDERQQPEFDALSQWDVHFYDSSPSLDRPPPVAAVPPVPAPGAPLPGAGEAEEFEPEPEWAGYPF